MMIQRNLFGIYLYIYPIKDVHPNNTIQYVYRPYTLDKHDQSIQYKTGIYIYVNKYNHASKHVLLLCI